LRKYVAPEESCRKFLLRSALFFQRGLRPLQPYIILYELFFKFFEKASWIFKTILQTSIYDNLLYLEWGMRFLIYSSHLR
jgi:hypothetical protein